MTLTYHESLCTFGGESLVLNILLPKVLLGSYLMIVSKSNGDVMMVLQRILANDREGGGF